MTKSSRSALAVVFLALISSLVFSQNPSNTTEKNDLSFAESSLVLALLQQQSGDLRVFCDKTPVACRQDAAGLALALIAARHTPSSLRSLAKLHRFVLDGAYGESFDEYVCDKRGSIEKYLVSQRPEQLRAQCVKEASGVIKDEPAFADVNVDRICWDEKSIRHHLQQSLEMIRRAPKSCEP